MKGMSIEGEELTIDDVKAIGVFIRKRFTKRKGTVLLNLTDFLSWDLSMGEVNNIFYEIFKGATEWHQVSIVKDDKK